MSQRDSETVVERRIACSYVGRREVVKALTQLRCTVGVKSATHEDAEDSIILIAKLDPKHDVNVVTDRIRSLTASWGKGPDAFPAQVEDFETQGAEHD